MPEPITRELEISYELNTKGFNIFLNNLAFKANVSTLKLNDFYLRIKNVDLKDNELVKIIWYKTEILRDSSNFRRNVNDTINNLLKLEDVRKELNSATIEQLESTTKTKERAKKIRNELHRLYTKAECTKMEKLAIWEKIREEGSTTDNMHPIPFINEMDMVHISFRVPVNSYIRYKVNLATEGHLLLLNKGVSGEIWCLCPSLYGTETLLSCKGMILPQLENMSGKNSFLPNEKGLEKILAIVTKEPIRLQWLENPAERTQPIDKRELLELLEFIKQNKSRQIFHTVYEVSE